MFPGFQLNTICLNRAKGWLLQLLPLGSLILLLARQFFGDSTPSGGCESEVFFLGRRICAIFSIGGLRPPVATQRNFCLEPTSTYDGLPLLTSLARVLETNIQEATTTTAAHTSTTNQDISELVAVPAAPVPMRAI